MSTGIQEELGKLLRGQVLAKVPLRERTTYRDRREASLLACPADLEDLRHLHAYLADKGPAQFCPGRWRQPAGQRSGFLGGGRASQRVQPALLSGWKGEGRRWAGTG